VKTVEDLREHLFETLQGLRNKSIPIAEAETAAKIAQVIVNSAKVECDMVRATGQRPSGFITLAAPAAPPLPAPGQPRLVSPLGPK
jgi:hypothetical protein